MEKVTNLILRCKVYERLFIYTSDGQDTPDSDTKTNLVAAIVDLYAKILSFLAICLKLYGKGTVRRAFHAIFNPEELSSQLASFRELEARVETEASNCDRDRAVTMQDSIEDKHEALQRLITGPLMRSDSRLAQMWIESSETERCRILQWISSIPHETDHYDARAGRTEGTGEWLLAHETFALWRDTSASTVLWLHGIRELYQYRSTRRQSNKRSRSWQDKARHKSSRQPPPRPRPRQ